MNIYAQLIDRSKRAHGAAFDALVTAPLRASSAAPETRLLGHWPRTARSGPPGAKCRKPSISSTSRMGAGGFEPPTSRV